MVDQEVTFSSVLLVEDQAAQLQVLADILSQEGFVVWAYRGATEALSQITTHTFGAAIVDINLSGDDGLRLLEQIRSMDDGLPVILHTAFGSYDAAKTALNLGGFAFIEKAGNPAELVRCVHRAVKHRAAMAYRESEERLFLAFDHSPNIFVIYDRNRRVCFANRKALKLAGRTLPELLGLRDEDVFPTVVTRAYLPILEAACRTSKRQAAERHIQWSARRHTFSIECMPQLDDRGAIHRLLTIMHNTTSRRLAQRALLQSTTRYRTLMDVANDAIIIAAAETGRILEANHQALEVTGRSMNELQGMTLWEICHQDDDEAKWRTLVEQGGVQGQIEPWELTLIHGSGGFVPVEATATEIEVGGGRCIQAVLRDLTERLCVQQQLRQLQDQLALYNRRSTIGEIASVLAHELNQPLGTITNYAGPCIDALQQRGLSAEEMVHVLQKIQEQARRAVEIIRRLKEFVSRDAPQKAFVDVSELCREVLQLVESEFTLTGTRIQLEGDDQPAFIMANRLQIQQVLLNLVQNAIEAMDNTPKKHRRIVISISTNEQQLQVAVRDHGTGIAAGELERIFDAYYTTKPAGLGMGLSICRKIIESHGGQLWATVHDNRGTTFQFTIPRSERNFENHLQPATRMATEARMDRRLSPS